MKPVTQLKQCKSVSVWVLQDAVTQEIAGKIISHYSDAGVCSTEAWIYQGSLANDDSPMQARCGGSGYNKFASNLCAIMSSKFETYADVRDLDAGLIHKWFAKHGYVATQLL